MPHWNPAAPTTVASQGPGYYNYYHVSGRSEVDTARQMPYERDLRSEEICPNNAGVATISNEGLNSDLFSKLDDIYEHMGTVNRARYATFEELQTALSEKYHPYGNWSQSQWAQTSPYAKYSQDERKAMYAHELAASAFGSANATGGIASIDIPTALKDPRLNGMKSENALSADSDLRGYNASVLGSQFANVLAKGGLDIGLLGDATFKFSVDGYSKLLQITVLAGEVADETLAKLNEAFNTGDNAKNLFYNLLYDGSREGAHDRAELAKWSLWSNFERETGRDIRDFQQRKNGFFDKDGKNAVDIFADAVFAGGASVPKGFEAVAINYFYIQTREALKYDLASVPDLTLSLTYQNGEVRLGE